MKEDTIKWKDNTLHGLENVKTLILTKAIYRFKAIPIKIPMTFFCRNRKFTLTFKWNIKGMRTAKTILKKSNKVIGIKLTDFKTYYKVTVIKQYGTGTKTDIYTSRTEERVQK